MIKFGSGERCMGRLEIYDHKEVGRYPNYIYIHVMSRWHLDKCTLIYWQKCPPYLALLFP